MKINIKFTIAVFTILISLSACDGLKKSESNESHKIKRIKISVDDFSQLTGIDTTKTLFIEEYVFADNDTLSLEHLTELVGDPQLYSIIKLKNNDVIFELKNIQGYKIDPKTKINLSNLVDSKLIFMTENKLKEKLIFVWDYQYPDCSNLFEIIKISKPKPTKIFSEDLLVKEISMNEEKTTLVISALKNCGELQREFQVKF
jgi:hypothetical protein